MDGDGSVPPDFLTSGRLESAIRDLGVDLIGTSIGVYHVTSLLGVGGMGEVYRARDTTLNRDVALKVLPTAFAHDADRLTRFRREAKTLASLNHPHIAIIHGLEQAGDVHALVMELVQGEDLSQRLTRGALPFDEALPIATQIAEALEAAHEQGIIHRDLKPANIKVRADGAVKVLDFGLAKALDSAGVPSASPSETVATPAMTEAGMILGTAAYMSPEQARGKPVDKRADIWAFGCVLFEMLTGKRAFLGDNVSEVLASVLAREPDWARLPVTLSPVVATYIRRCLHKDPRQRIHDIADVRLALQGAFETPAPQTATPVTSSSKGARLAWVAVAAVGTVALAIPTMRHLRETPPPASPETRTEIVTPATDDPGSFALSPDGRQIVFAASGDGARRLWLRSLAMPTAQPLAGTEGASASFLGTRQPVHWLLRPRRTEAARHRRRCAKDPDSGHQPLRRDLEHGRRHRVWAGLRDPPDARLRHRRECGRRRP